MAEPHDAREHGLTDVPSRSVEVDPLGLLYAGILGFLLVGRFCLVLIVAVLVAYYVVRWPGDAEEPQVGNAHSGS